MTGGTYLSGPGIPDWAPGPEPREKPLPAWKEPEFPAHRDFPREPLKPSIQPTEPWKDPEPKPSRE